MPTATVVSEEKGRPYWFAEQDLTHESVFIHIKCVKRERYLHAGDRVRFDLAPNPKHPEKMQAVNVEWIGAEIAIQQSATVRP